MFEFNWNFEIITWLNSIAETAINSAFKHVVYWTYSFRKYFWLAIVYCTNCVTKRWPSTSLAITCFDVEELVILMSTAQGYVFGPDAIFRGLGRSWRDKPGNATKQQLTTSMGQMPIGASWRNAIITREFHTLGIMNQRKWRRGHRKTSVTSRINVWP